MILLTPMATNKTYARLRVSWEDRATPLLASAAREVPPLWLGLFDYDDTTVDRDDTLDLLRAVAPVAAARQRGRDLLAALPPGDAALKASAGELVAALDGAPAGGRLELDASRVLAAMQPDECHATVQRLVNLCDVQIGRASCRERV